MHADVRWLVFLPPSDSHLQAYGNDQGREPSFTADSGAWSNHSFNWPVLTSSLVSGPDAGHLGGECRQVKSCCKRQHDACSRAPCKEAGGSTRADLSPARPGAVHGPRLLPDRTSQTQTRTFDLSVCRFGGPQTASLMLPLVANHLHGRRLPCCLRTSGIGVDTACKRRLSPAEPQCILDYGTYCTTVRLEYHHNLRVLCLRKWTFVTPLMPSGCSFARFGSNPTCRRCSPSGALASAAHQRLPTTILHIAISHTARLGGRRQ